MGRKRSGKKKCKNPWLRGQYGNHWDTYWDNDPGRKPARPCSRETARKGSGSEAIYCMHEMRRQGRWCDALWINHMLVGT